ncbi:tetratricopeptide repeat protein [Desulfoluna spongiiphila]|uniref:tetratricopeptide repeat protein n=1 Tax=Desulfoluna spongiiphila TaxID=419481 RepID=UPI0012518F0E|nr:sel1 repeat family protein [Desulfoluna spongiiphila]VVS93864.1 tetratricopeptide-like helical domain superfamily [Desulfoluna spongiiphila]
MKRFIAGFSVLFLWAGATWATGSEDKLALLEAAVEGDTTAQYTLAETYAEEAGIHDLFDQDIELLKKAVHWYEKAAEKGHTPSQKALASIYLFPLDDAPPEWSTKWLPLAKKLVDKGDRKAQYDLARYYSFPHNCDTRFRQCLNRAIGLYGGLLKDLPPGQATVFRAFEISPRKITRQEIETEIARLKAMDPEAQEKQSAMDSLLYSTRKSGSLQALVGLGDRWAAPDSAGASISMAKKAYEYAAEKNHPEAQMKYAGILYQHAKGIGDYQNAYLWAMAATMNGYPSAPELLAKITQKLPEEDLPAMEAEAKRAINTLGE